jgi:hypothetical protein
MWALIVDNSVFEITDTDPTERFHESLEWAECGADVTERWRYSDGTFLPPAELESAAGPLVCTPYQFRKALNLAGLRTQVEAAVAAGDQDTKDAWNHATSFVQDNDKVMAMAQALGQTDEQIKTLFELAVTLSP